MISARVICHTLYSCAMSDVATSKGTILKSLYKFITTELNDAQLESFRARLDPEDASWLQSRILSSGRVPESTLNRMTEAAASVIGENVESFGNRAGRAELLDSVKVYRFLFAILTPPALLARASSLWSTVHSHGRLDVIESTGSSARVRLSDYPSERAHCARLGGWIEGISEMTKVHNPRMEHDICQTRGEGDCEWVVTWSS